VQEYRLIHDYKHHADYRQSFGLLAKQIFSIDFEHWYNLGYWGDAYVCFSYLYHEQVIANVSISRMDMVCHGKPIKAIQVGTVMTHPDHRGQGLAGKLMRFALSQYANSYDLAFLFANRSVLDFYPRFGFQRLEQQQFSVSLGQLASAPQAPRRLDLSLPADLQTLLRLSRQRQPVSQTLGVVNVAWLLMFYCLHLCGQDVYYLPELDAVTIHRVEGELLQLYDVISARPFNLDQIVAAIVPAGVKRLQFHFTPDQTSLPLACEDWQSSDGLFFLPADFKFPERFMFPTMCQA
jgi:GNAT superfamily N-acetyltransferase